ncbi:MAG: dTDP-4-dehydrorhamnose 3,5-epimerase family protein [Nitrospiria bacterium]
MQTQLRQIIAQLEVSQYRSEAGPLENNISFQKLRKLAGLSDSGSDSLVIQGVWLKPLVTHTDERGFFREVLRATDDIFSGGFGQWSHSHMVAGTIKAWHIHFIQTDLFYLPIGVAKVVLHDYRQDSPTYRLTNEFVMGEGHEPEVLKIPPGVAHGLKVISGPAHLFYITSHVYNPDDEGRVAHDDPGIGYDWLKGPEIK